MHPLLRPSWRFLYELRLTCYKISCNRKRGSYCFLLRCSRVGCTVSGWAPGSQWSLRTCGMLGAKWAHSWAAYWALWRRRIVTSRRPRPFFNLTGPLVCSLAYPRHPQPQSSPHRTGELGLSALDRYISTTVVSKWFNISFVQHHILRPRPTPRELVR